VKQPVRAWGPDTLERLRAGFEAGDWQIRRLLADIMVVAAFPPAAPVPAQAASEPPR
jgi:hypothetical protein